MISELTKFFQEYIEERLKTQLDQLQMGFYIKPEKFLKGCRFDIYAYSRKRQVFLIWELEIYNTIEGCIKNIKKVKRVLNLDWLPYVHMFHIFSPLCESYKKECARIASAIKKKYEARFTYKQFDITIHPDEFWEIYESFNRNKNNAKRRYGKRLKIHIGKIITGSIGEWYGK
jgi:hypothetical protein